jgi:hypothetical protein
MQVTLRSLAGLIVFLAPSAGPASALDQSATEETNCLMACDANQENCHAGGHVSAGKYRLSTEQSSSEARLSRSVRSPANFSPMDRGALSKERSH